MKRKSFKKRENFEEINNELGFDFQVVEEKQYWIEDVGYEFSSKEVTKLEDATNKVHQMCFEAIDFIIKNNRFKDFNIPEKVIPYIKKSWEREDWSLYGRFDFCFDGNKIKVFEYNADTPTSLVEASLAQYEWMKGQGLKDQFNSIDEKMLAWWEAYKEEKEPTKVYFTTVKENHEDFRNTEYIMDVAHRAGLETDFIFLEDIGSDGEYLYDLENNPIEHLFKLYPWEWLVQEEYIDTLLCDNCTIIEPVWKMLLSNKALMAILWELFPNNEYLLPTYFSPEKLGKNYVKKPILSREGQNVEIISQTNSESKEGLYESEHNIYQEICVLPLIDNYYPVIGSWIIGEESAGIGIREDESKITANLSRFVPHYINDEQEQRNFNINSTKSDVSVVDLSIIKNNQINNLHSKNTEVKMKKNNSNLIENLEEIVKVVFGIAIFVGAISFFIYSIKQNNIEVEKENSKIVAHNQQQQKFLSEVFSDAKKNANVDWVKKNVDEKNQAIFLNFIDSMRELVIKGSQDESTFYSIDSGMTKNVFCIQGEKDVKNFETFQSMLFETEKEKEFVQSLKMKYKYSEHKTEIPSQEDLLEICNFKDFEKDFKEINQVENSKETDPNKKIVSEEQSQQDEE